MRPGNPKAHLSAKQAEALKYLLENLDVSSYAAIQDVAEVARVDEATLIRLARRLGFAGYRELRQDIRHLYIRSLKPSEALSEHQSEELGTPGQAIITRDMENLETVLRS